MCWETGPLSNSLLHGAFISATVTRKIYLERKVFFIIHFGFKPYFWELKMELKNGFDRVEFTSIFLLRQKNPRILKFIENSVFNSFVNSCLIIKSYKISNQISLVLYFNINVYLGNLISVPTVSTFSWNINSRISQISTFFTFFFSSVSLNL